MLQILYNSEGLLATYNSHLEIQFKGKIFVGDEIISMKINPTKIVIFVFRKRDIEIRIFGGDEMECSIESKTFGADEMAKKRKSASPSESLL